MARTEKIGRSYASALRMKVGIGRPWSISRLAKETRIARRTLRSYLADETRPSPEKHELICEVLGEDFRALVDVERGRVSISIDAQPVDAAEYHEAVSELDAEMTRRWRDGVFDHRDQAETAPMVAKVSMMGMTMVRTKRTA